MTPTLQPAAWFHKGLKPTVLVSLVLVCATMRLKFWQIPSKEERIRFPHYFSYCEITHKAWHQIIPPPHRIQKAHFNPVAHTPALVHNGRSRRQLRWGTRGQGWGGCSPSSWGAFSSLNKCGPSVHIAGQILLKFPYWKFIYLQSTSQNNLSPETSLWIQQTQPIFKNKPNYYYLLLSGQVSLSTAPSVLKACFLNTLE